MDVNRVGSWKLRDDGTFSGVAHPLGVGSSMGAALEECWRWTSIEMATLFR